MPNYTRPNRPGAQIFFTVRLADRNATTLVDHVDLLRHAMRQTITRYPYQIDDIVVLPHLLHTIWTLPPDDADFSKRWRMIKSLFSRQRPTPPHRDPVTIRRGDKGIWQRRFWEHHIHDADDLIAHRHMIYTAPVQAGLVAHPSAWPFSSLPRAIDQGTWAPYDGVGKGYSPAPPDGLKLVS